MSNNDWTEDEIIADSFADTHLDGGEGGDGYSYEEYDIGPNEQQIEQQMLGEENMSERYRGGQGASQGSNLSSVDFRMGAPAPKESIGSLSDSLGYQRGADDDFYTRKNLDSRLQYASDNAPPEGLQVSGSRVSGRNLTGPKSVLADSREADRILRSHRMMKNLRTQQAQRGNQKIVTGDPMDAENKSVLSDDDDFEDEDEDDKAFFEQMRKNRVNAVQNSLPVFGTFERISKDQLAHITKDVHELVYVVCHLYENYMETCCRVNLALERIAPQFPHVKFVRARATEVLQSFKDAGLPTLLLFKGGKMISSAVRVTDPLPRDFSDFQFAKILEAKGILSVPTGEEEYAKSQLKGRSVWEEPDEDTPRSSGATNSIRSGLQINRGRDAYLSDEDSD